MSREGISYGNILAEKEQIDKTEKTKYNEVAIKNSKAVALVSGANVYRRAMIKAAFFDLDGTLVSSQGTYSPAVKEALQTLRRNGILVFAATGRAPYEFEITKMIEGLEFDAIVALNGQLCYNEQEMIYRRLFDREDAVALIAQANKCPFPCMVIEQNDMYINYIDDHVRFALQAIHTPLPEVRDITHAADREILMIMAYLPQEDTQKLVLPVLKHSVVTRWNPFGIDVLPIGCGKYAGIAQVLRKYNLTWENVIAFGDGENDYEMLKRAKYGVAMGNSDPMLLTGEFTVTGSVEADGVVTALRQFALI